MKTRLTLTVTLTVALLAGVALAQDFHPILDADYIGYPDTDTGFASHLTCSRPGPQSDPEWGPVTLTAGDASMLVAATFDALHDADFLGTSGYGTEAATHGDAVCRAACQAKVGGHDCCM